MSFSLGAGFLDTLARWTGYNAPGGFWRIAAIALALINLKILPFVWHLRFFRAFLYQLYLQPIPIPPNALFQPVITATRTPLFEMDYNLHKSNSTYFSDMDISRTHLFTAIIRNGIKKNSRLYGAKKSAVAGAVGATEGTRGKHMIALGGISCLFKKEVLPYHKYEMWTRVLSWDRKWFYLVTHIVKPGVGRPTSWTLQPWKKGSKAPDDVDPEKLKGAIYASAIAKYVIKRGRITVSPEQVLLDADMVPPKPEGWVYNGTTDFKDVGVDALPESVGEEQWNWDVIEKERLKGLAVAEHFAGLDELHDHFTGGRDGALGEFSGYLLD